MEFSKTDQTNRKTDEVKFSQTTLNASYSMKRVLPILSVLCITTSGGSTLIDHENNDVNVPAPMPMPMSIPMPSTTAIGSNDDIDGECSTTGSNACKQSAIIHPDGSILLQQEEHNPNVNVNVNVNKKATELSIDLNSPSLSVPSSPADHDDDMEENDEQEQQEQQQEDEENYTFTFHPHDIPNQNELKSIYTDQHENCQIWASEGACNADPTYMLKECISSCIFDKEVQHYGLLSWTYVPQSYLDGQCVNFHDIEQQQQQQQEEEEAAERRTEDDNDEDDDDNDEEEEEEEEEEGCAEWMKVGLCRSPEDKPFMLHKCRRSCRICHHPQDEEYELGVGQRIPLESLNETLTVLRDMATYIQDTFLNPMNYLYGSTRSSCENEDMHCAIWGAEGRCDPDHEDYEWMVMNCAPVCQTCELQDFSIRCPIPDDAVDALATHGGDNGLHAMFERIVGERELTQAQLDAGLEDMLLEKKFQVNIISRPMDERRKNNGTIEDDDDDDDDEKDDGAEEKDKENDEDDNGSSISIIDGPWVITLENFITEEECEEMIKAGTKIGYHTSVETITNRDGTQGEDFESEDRTSTNAWCDDECKENAVIQRVQERIALVTGFPVENSEDLQLLHYETGQFYNVHHDLITAHVKGPSGPRVLTFFLYLNDLDEDAGGGTRFPELSPGAPSVTIQPKRGTALVWPSVLDEDINEGDYRTEHEALPVKSGVKYGANAWLHLRSEDIKGIDCG